MEDPRFLTVYAKDYNGVLFHNQNTFLLPPFLLEKWCRPGYQPTRKSRAVKLLFNDYPYHQLQYDYTWKKITNPNSIQRYFV